MVQQFLATAAQQLGNAVPQKACFAIAGPVVNNTAKLTNLTWFLDAKRLEQELELHPSLINDFAAVGYGVLGLDASDLCTLQTGISSPDCGDWAGTDWEHFNSAGRHVSGILLRGGHVDFSELEFQLLKYLLDRHNIQRVSAERVVSGQGIVTSSCAIAQSR